MDHGVHYDCWLNSHSPEFSKTLASEAFIGMTWPVEFAGSVLGAEAMLDNPCSTNLVCVPSYTIMGGTSDIMGYIIGDRVLGLHR